MYCRFLNIIAKTANELNENLISSYSILYEFTRISKELYKKFLRDGT